MTLLTCMQGSQYTLCQTHVSLHAYKFDKIYYCKSGYLCMEEIYTSYTVSLKFCKLPPHICLQQYEL